MGKFKSLTFPVTAVPWSDLQVGQCMGFNTLYSFLMLMNPLSSEIKPDIDSHSEVAIHLKKIVTVLMLAVF